MDDFPPTAQDIEVKEVLSAEVEVAMKNYQKLIDEDVTSFNKAFKKEQRDFLKIE
jgi:hypothetical protein